MFTAMWTKIEKLKAVIMNSTPQLSYKLFEYGSCKLTISVTQHILHNICDHLLQRNHVALFVYRPCTWSDTNTRKSCYSFKLTEKGGGNSIEHSTVKVKELVTEQIWHVTYSYLVIYFIAALLYQSIT